MEKLSKAGRIFYGTGMADLGFQQFLYGNFRPVILPSWPSIPAIVFWAYLTGVFFIVAGIAIIFDKKGRMASLILGGLLLMIFCFGQVSYELFVDPYTRHLGVWTNALKELALSGGAFVMAASFPEPAVNRREKPFLIRLLERFIPLGPVFFSITLISFGIDHFFYMETVAALVPSWMPDHVFWTYFAAVALIGSGVAIILKIRLRIITLLLGSMLFLWFASLHIPRAIADPYGADGNEITSVFEALAFSGIAFVMAAVSRKNDDPVP